MKTVIMINLDGRAYQLEDDGCHTLRVYLQAAAERLQGNPDRDEILADIERAIGEKFRARLSPHKDVITTPEVVKVLEEMGPIENDSADAVPDGAPLGSTPRDPGRGPETSIRRLYRIHEGAMVSGVCNGIGAYAQIDPNIVRLIFVVLTLLWGAGALLYVALIIILPVARSPEEKAAAEGAPFTAQDFIHRAKAGYYDAVRNLSDQGRQREWRRTFRREMRDWRRRFDRTMRAQSRHGQSLRPVGMPPLWVGGAGLTLPLLSLLHGAIVLVWLSAVVSLLGTGTVFGATLPGSLPVWITLVLLLMGYGLVVWPLKAARRAFYYQASGDPTAPAFVLADVIVWLAVMGVMAWLAFHHWAEVSAAIQHLPEVVAGAANSIRDWWHSR
jgi:phage shock protein PspC (stress-responsive transcriptional regulator)